MTGIKEHMEVIGADGAETGSHMSEWLSSPGLQPPKPA